MSRNRWGRYVLVWRATGGRVTDAVYASQAEAEAAQRRFYQADTKAVVVNLDSPEVTAALRQAIAAEERKGDTA